MYLEGVLVNIHRRGRLLDLIFRIDYRTKKLITVTDFYPYFYVRDDRGWDRSIFNERVRKIVLDDPSRVPEERRRYEKHYEADVPYVRRFLIDREIYKSARFPDKREVSQYEISSSSYDFPLRVFYLDIEVLCTEGFPDPQSATMPIILVTVYDTYSRKYLTLLYKRGEKYRRDLSSDHILCCFPTEEEMLSFLISFFERLDPDIVTGWNISFDLNYLCKRCENLNLRFPTYRYDVFDLLQGYRRLFKRPTYRLKEVAYVEGIAPDRGDVLPNDIPRLYESNIDKLIEYNWRDVYYIVKLDEKHRILQSHLELKWVAGVERLEETFYNNVLIDTVLLRKAKKRNVVLPSKPEKTVEREYEGAIVLNPPRGIVENVAIFDMKSYYPMIMLTFNLSPEVKSKYPAPNAVFVNGCYWKQNVRGIITEVLEDLLSYESKLKSELKKLTPGTEEHVSLSMRRNAVKFLRNAVYGVCAFPYFRLYDVDVASTVTAIAREGILHVREYVESRHGFKVLYCDTDSIFVQCNRDTAEKLLEDINEEIRRYFREKYNVRDVKIEIEWKAYCRRIVFAGVKKRYVAHIVWEDGKDCDYVKIVGFDAVRSDVSEFTRRLQEELFSMIIRGASKDEVARYVREKVEEFKQLCREGRYDVIAIPKGISKSLHEYKNKPPHVRGAIIANMYLGCNFTVGSRVKMLYVKHVPNIPTDVICFEHESQLPKGTVIDVDKMLEVSVRRKIEDILELVGLSWENIFSSGSILSFL